MNTCLMSLRANMPVLFAIKYWTPKTHKKRKNIQQNKINKVVKECKKVWIETTTRQRDTNENSLGLYNLFQQLSQLLIRLISHYYINSK